MLDQKYYAPIHILELILVCNVYELTFLFYACNFRDGALMLLTDRSRMNFVQIQAVSKIFNC